MPCRVKGQEGVIGFSRLQHAKLSARGQGMAIDFLFAVLIFLLLLNAVLSLWASSSKSFEKEALLSELNARASQTIDLLVRDSGTPNDWEARAIGDVQIIGLASTDRQLDSEKVSRFSALAQNFWSDDYNRVRQKMLLASDFYFKISSEQGTTIAQTALPPTELQEKWWVINVKRIVNYGGEAAIAEFSLYHPKYP